MKKSRYSDNQILSIFKPSESGTTVPDLCCSGIVNLALQIMPRVT